MRQKSINNILIVGVAFVIFALMMFDRGSVRKYKDSRILMDTLVEITVYGNGKQKLKSSVNEAFDEIKRIENLMSGYISNSEIARINDAGGNALSVSPESAAVIQAAKDVGRLTDGAFDVTLGGLTRLWGFTSESPRVPQKSEIEELLAHTGSDIIEIKNYYNGKQTIVSIRLTDPATTIDLGGIAKGYAIGMAARRLRERGIESALIDAGGDIVVIGDKKGKPFRIGIKSPDDDSVIGVIEASDISIVTSGDYERGFSIGGVRYHHILDPKTGRPARRSRSVTIITKDAILADALSTAVFVMGREKGLKLINSLKGVEAFIVDETNKMFMSDNAGIYIKTGDQ